MKSGLKTIGLSLLVMALWGSLFPMVKIAYGAFGISSGSIPDILMFAGVMFVVCGLAACLYSGFRKEKIATPKPKSILRIFVMGLFSVVLHYACTYIGLSMTDSSKTALIKQLGVLLYVCFAFLFLKDETFSLWKIIGAVIGFAGILVINYAPGGITFAVGDLLIIGASVCTVVANIISKKSVQGSSPFWITGISQLSGGIILVMAALIMGADWLTFTWESVAVFAYVCAASVTAYTLWYSILKHNSLSKMFIIKFAEPLFACVFGALLLGEDILKLQYLLAFALISLGIVLGNKKEKMDARKESETYRRKG